MGQLLQLSPTCSQTKVVGMKESSESPGGLKETYSFYLGFLVNPPSRAMSLSQPSMAEKAKLFKVSGVGAQWIAACRVAH